MTLKFGKLVLWLFADLGIAFILTLFLISDFASHHGELVQADAFLTGQPDASVTDISYPYTKTFTISAYYSPLPCQTKYVTGSYSGDIRLNGSGVNGADGTPVYPGMIAAPRSYDFGTKMYIPDVGIVAVHDRGGAIVSSNTPGYYDRLDIWMGYGDTGLKRALNWGKRTMDVTVYGVTDSVVEDIYLEGYSPDEASYNNQCEYSQPSVEIQTTEYVPAAEPEVNLETGEKELELSKAILDDLKFGDTNDSVIQLQDELTALNLYKGPLTGYYGELTEHAVFKFQQAQKLVGDKTSPGAGIFGPKTRDRMNEIIASRNYTDLMIAQKTIEKQDVILAENEEDEIREEVQIVENPEKKTYLAYELDFGISNEEVKKLQTFLKEQGFFTGAFVTDYFGPATKSALIDFQLANEIINSAEDLGAGRVGPATLKLINSYS